MIYLLIWRFHDLIWRFHDTYVYKTEDKDDLYRELAALKEEYKYDRYDFSYEIYEANRLED